MLCYAYGYTFDPPEGVKALSTLYCSMDEKEAIEIAKSEAPNYRNTVVKAMGQGVLYHSNGGHVGNERV